MSRVKIFVNGLDKLDNLDSRYFALVSEFVSVVYCCQEGPHRIYEPISLSGHRTLRLRFLHGLSSAAQLPSFLRRRKLLYVRLSLHQLQHRRHS